jgi:hypothetical protein
MSREVTYCGDVYLKTGIQLHPPANSEERVSVVKYHRYINISRSVVD